MTSSAFVSRQRFGAYPDGTEVAAVTLSDGRLEARLLTYGATLQSLIVPDRRGERADIVLGHDDLAPYIVQPNYLGSAIGRYANRIRDGRFVLDGEIYQVPRNNGDHCLHGGSRGFDSHLWEIAALAAAPVPTLVLTRISPDGEEGFPGTLTVELRVELIEDAVRFTFTATTDRPTIVNLTNHAYFNLAGAEAGQDVLGHRLEILADAYHPVDPGLIPSGEATPVAGTPFDFRTPQPIGVRVRDGREAQLVRARGYDHDFILRGGVAPEPRLAARVEEPLSGRVLEMLTTEPGLQFYSGNFLDGTLIGKGGTIYRQSAGFCLEPQKHPNSPNRPDMPSPRLDPGQTYRHVMAYRFPRE